jgi:hypothetical protein
MNIPSRATPRHLVATDQQNDQALLPERAVNRVLGVFPWCIRGDGGRGRNRSFEFQIKPLPR